MQICDEILSFLRCRRGNENFAHLWIKSLNHTGRRSRLSAVTSHGALYKGKFHDPRFRLYGLQSSQ